MKKFPRIKSYRSAHLGRSERMKRAFQRMDSRNAINLSNLKSDMIASKLALTDELNN